MTTPFGPQLIGETEKTLSALLGRALAGRLTERQWVTLRLAHLVEAEVERGSDLAAQVAARAHFEDAPALVEGLTAAGLLTDGRPTDAGRRLVAEVQDRIAAATDPIWQRLPDDDVAATTRVLNEIVTRARALLAASR